MMTGAQQQLSSLIEARNRAVQQQAYLSSLLAQYEAAGVENIGSGSPQSIDQQIEVSENRVGGYAGPLHA